MIEKFKDGETVQDYRHRRKVARKAAKADVQKELRQRDGMGCRWPGCELWKRGYVVHNVHLEDAGMGGDPALIRTQRRKMLRLCYAHHSGVLSIHSKDLRVIPLTERGTDSECQFEMRNYKAPNGWEVVGIEDPFTFTPRETDDDGED